MGIKNTENTENEIKSGKNSNEVEYFKTRIENEIDQDTYMDTIDEISNFNIDFNGNIFQGKEGFSKILKILNTDYSKTSNFLELLLNNIISEGFLDINILEEHINRILMLNIRDQKNKEKEDKEKEQVKIKRSLGEQLKYIYSNFDISNFENFDGMLKEAETEVNKFILDNPELENKKEDYIKSYILVKNKKNIINEYKSNIGKNNNYNINGLEDLKNNIISVEKTIKHNDVVFNKYLYSKNINVEKITRNTNIDKLLKSKITNYLSPVGGKDEKVKYEGEYITIGDQRITINEKGEVLTEIFNKANYSIKIDTELSLELLDSYNNERKIEDNISNLNIEKDNINKKIEFLESEIKEYENEGYDNQSIKDIKIRLLKYKNHINTIVDKIENYKRIQIQNNIKIQELEYNTRISNQEKTDKARETMEFVNDIGYDLLPQELTNELINRLNRNSSMRNMFGFNSNIDLANGTLGIEKDFDKNNISIIEKVSFTRILNIFISGEENKPINLESVKAGYRAVGDRTKFKSILNDYGMLSNVSNSLPIGLSNLQDFFYKKSNSSEK